jgi:AcrR family transcriptional regulator
MSRKNQVVVIDRRVLKTRQALHQALIALILEKGYDAITVKDIIEQANVGRSTFYAHYTDKEELLQGGLSDLRKLLMAHQKTALATPGSPRLAFSVALFEHAAGYRTVYRAMVGKRAGSVVLNRLRVLLSELVKVELASTTLPASVRDVPQGALVDYLVGSLLSVLTWWVDEKASLPPAQADAIYRRLALAAME